MAINAKRPNTPLFILRSLTGAVHRVEARHRDRGPQLAVPGERLADIAMRFAESYDEVHRLDRQNAALKEHSDQEAAALGASAADWAVVFACDIAGFDAVDWKPQRRTTDEVVRAASQMRTDIARAHETTPLDGGDAAIADMQTHIEIAKAALVALKNGLAAEQEQRNQTRELGREFMAKSRAYRRVLGRTIGQRHRDYRALDTSQRAVVSVPEIADLDSTEGAELDAKGGDIRANHSVVASDDVAAAELDTSSDLEASERSPDTRPESDGLSDGAAA